MRVFGYGSLVVLSAQRAVSGDCAARLGAERFVLEGWRRTWGVAMDNRVAIPGYKVYEDPATGERPAVVVCFLDLVPDPASSVTGALLEAPDLAALDRRERQYERVAVGDDLVAYAGRREGRERAARGRGEGIAVIQRSYHDLVAATVGDDLPPPDVPLRDLRRIDL